MDTNTVQIVQEFGNKLDGYIITLSDKLGVAADHFWPVFVKQQTVEGWTTIIGLFLALVGVFLFLKMALKNTEAANATGGNNYYLATAKCFAGWGVSVVLFTIFLACAVADGKIAISQIINPEYSAVSNLIRMVK